MEIDQNVKEINQKDHANILAKAKKAISAALMAGMLASPVAAKEMKNKTTYNEPTRVERSAEQVSPEQAICNDAKKLFQDIVGSDLSQTVGDEDLSKIVITNKNKVAEAEIKDFVNRLYNIVNDLNKVQCDYNGGARVANGIITGVAKRGFLCYPGNGNLIRMINAAVDEDVAIGRVSWRDREKRNEEYRSYYIGDMSKTNVEYDNKNDDWPGLGVYAHKDIIRNNPVNNLSFGMKYISKNVEHLRDMMPEGCGPAPVREAWIWANLSVDTLEEIQRSLDKNHYIYNDINALRPDKVLQQQADMGMQR